MRDLAGQRFGKLTVVAPTEARKGGGIVWHCACDCGRECDVRSDYLVRGRVTSCGHDSVRRSRSKDLVGQRFGKLVVKERVDAGADHAVWLCDCDCGNECEASTYALTSGRKRSCGCMRGRPLPAGEDAAGAAEPERAAVAAPAPAPSANDTTPAYDAALSHLACGMRFGKLLLVDEQPPDAHGAPIWRCVCDCNRVVHIPAADLQSGTATSCGHCGPPALSS